MLVLSWRQDGRQRPRQSAWERMKMVAEVWVDDGDVCGVWVDDGDNDDGGGDGDGDDDDNLSCMLMFVAASC